LPHEFAWHGLTHFKFTHAIFDWHWSSDVHSGLHIGGEPNMFGTHEQTAWPFELSLHWLCGPHGDGEHGFIGSFSIGSMKKYK
jgi:hypothetical protein